MPQAKKVKSQAAINSQPNFSWERNKKTLERLFYAHLSNLDFVSSVLATFTNTSLGIGEAGAEGGQGVLFVNFYASDHLIPTKFFVIFYIRAELQTIVSGSIIFSKNSISWNGTGPTIN